MGLEAATYIQSLDAANPLAGDRKNQGDDHLRLLKSVLRASFPNLDRAFRVSEVIAKNLSYTVLDTDDSKTILCDTTLTFTLTLPVGLTFDGWLVRVMKTTTDVNPVYVAPPSGTINGLAKVRCNVPFVEYVFMWTGSEFIRVKAPGEESPGSIEMSGAAAVPVGYAVASGQSLLRADHPELFAVWSTTFGFVDGTHFNAPSLLDRFLVAAGGSYALGATGGEAAHALTIGELASHNHANTDVAHDHNIPGGAATTGGTSTFSANIAAGATAIPIGSAAIDISAANANLVATQNTGSNTAHENRPPYFALYPLFRLC